MIKHDLAGFFLCRRVRSITLYLMGGGGLGGLKKISLILMIRRFN